jgi:hypothetical protein
VIAATLPTLNQLRPYIADEECYLVTEELEQVFTGLTVDSGFYMHPITNKPADHGWCVSAERTIFDTTHRQFVRSRPIVIAAVGTRLHRRYHSWSEHHPLDNPRFCLFRALGVTYACDRAVGEPWLGICDYWGRENPKHAQHMAARALAQHQGHSPTDR